jgi:ABC-type lipoprotein export system ATPase subunit
MIELKAVSKIFRTDIIETYALRDFDLSVNAGEFVAITGHSGSGKTTLLSALSADTVRGHSTFPRHTSGVPKRRFTVR